MTRRPPSAILTDTLFPYTTLCRSWKRNSASATPASCGPPIGPIRPSSGLRAIGVFTSPIAAAPLRIVEHRRVRHRHRDRAALQRHVQGLPLAGVAALHQGHGDRAAAGRAVIGRGEERKSVVWGKSVSERVDLVGRRIIKKK